MTVRFEPKTTWFLLITLASVYVVLFIMPFRSWTSKPITTYIKSAKMLQRKTPKTLSFPISDENSAKTTSCQKKTNFGFLKTHKCGGTTVASILKRFAYRHDLNVILPKNSDIQFTTCQHSFKPYMALPPTSRPFNALFHETTWNSKEIKKMLPNDTIYFTIVRDPVDQFESFFGYLNFEKEAKITLQELGDGKESKYLFDSCYGFNSMMSDLGFPKSLTTNKTAIQKRVLEADEEFDFVMILEELDKSLILLKDLLCWDIEDIYYLKFNARAEGRRVSLSEKQRNNIRKNLMADQIYYDYFYKKFREKVEMYGKEKMNVEVEKLRTFINDYEKQCLIAVENKEGIMRHQINATGKCFQEPKEGFTIYLKKHRW